MQDKTSTISTNIPCGLYVLKHKDFDVAMVDIDIYSGKIQYILDVYLPEECPIGCKSDWGRTLLEGLELL